MPLQGQGQRAWAPLGAKALPSSLAPLTSTKYNRILGTKVGPKAGPRTESLGEAEAPWWLQVIPGKTPGRGVFELSCEDGMRLPGYEGGALRVADLRKGLQIRRLQETEIKTGVSATWPSLPPAKL